MDTGVVDVADLGKLGFWRLVAVVKRDRVLVEAHADQIGRIDTAAFRAGVRLRAPVWVGNLVMVLGIVLGGAAVWVAFASTTAWVKGLALILAGGIWAVAVHTPAHWLVGRAIGIRFTDCFLGGPPPPRPGLKTAYATYLRADPDSRAWFHASGAIATKCAPFVALAFWPASGAPWWSRGGAARDRRRPDRHGHHVVGEVERLEEVPAREGGGARDGAGAEDRSRVAAHPGRRRTLTYTALAPPGSSGGPG